MSIIELSPFDAYQLETFRRFLSVTVKAEDGTTLVPAGWMPYVLGVGPAPVPRNEAVPFTAWRLPSHDDARSLAGVATALGYKFGLHVRSMLGKVEGNSFRYER